jgi:hypothetical protein
MSLPGSFMNYGSAAAPAAGAAVVSLASVPAGVYFARAFVLLSGTLAAGDQDNIRFQVPSAVGGQQQSSLQLLVVPTANIWAPRLDIGRLVVQNTGAVSLNAIANATAGSVYRAVLILDPLLN